MKLYYLELQVLDQSEAIQQGQNGNFNPGWTPVNMALPTAGDSTLDVQQPPIQTRPGSETSGWQLNPPENKERHERLTIKLESFKEKNLHKG